MSKAVVVVGAGGHASVVIATLQAVGTPIVCAVDDDPDRIGGEILGVEIRGPVAAAPDFAGRGVLAIGGNRTRQSLATELELDWIAAIHPQAIVHPSASIGPGSVVFAGAVVQPHTKVGAHAIINTGARVDHDCRIGDFCHIAPGVSLAGGVVLGEGVLMGIGSCAIPGVRVGDWTRVGAGSAVTAELPDSATAVGSPARIVERRAE